ncbi:hypothetical protein ACFOMH_20355 [Paracoccus mangrovi]|jgi:antitoxin (DNA-binding transcriptional repressor) of toxin-antitoxin stability system|uniref:Uncharacterized protein n=1 Tax=Paracoccus mangrovi TaxID=1715645 RepID=A0ABV7RDU8_9RHOB
MAEPEIKTIAQTTLRTHWSRYLNEVVAGKSKIGVKDQSDNIFLIICKNTDHDEISTLIKSGEARDKLSDVFSQVKSGVTFRVINKHRKEVVFKRSPEYDYPLTEPVRKFWEEKIYSEIRSPDRIENIESLIKSNNENIDEKVDKIFRLVRHAVRASHGLRNAPIDTL